MTADDNIKCRCANSGMTGQVGGFQNPGLCLQAFPSFIPHPLPALFLIPFFARSLTLVPRSLQPAPHGNAFYAGYKNNIPYLVARRALRFKRGQRKCPCRVGGQISPTRINNNYWKLIYVSRTIPSSQYETNLWSTHVNIVRLTEPIRRCVCWRTQVFKIEGFVCKRFLPSPPPPPFSFFGSCFISRAAKTENPVPPSFFAPKPHGNACYAGYPIMLPDYCHLWLGLTGRFIFHTVWRQIERC